MLYDLQTGKVIQSVILSKAFAIFPLWKLRAGNPPMHLEFQTALPLHAFRIPAKETLLSLGIPRCRPWYTTRE